MGLFTYQLDSIASSSIVVDLLSTNMKLNKVLLVLNVDMLCYFLLCGLCWRPGGTPSKVLFLYRTTRQATTGQFLCEVLFRSNPPLQVPTLPSVMIPDHSVTLQCCVTVSVHVGIYVMTLYDVTGFNNTVSTMRREVRCTMGDRQWSRTE